MLTCANDAVITGRGLYPQLILDHTGFSSSSSTHNVRCETSEVQSCTRHPCTDLNQPAGRRNRLGKAASDFQAQAALRVALLATAPAAWTGAIAADVPARHSYKNKSSNLKWLKTHPGQPLTTAIMLTCSCHHTVLVYGGRSWHTSYRTWRSSRLHKRFTACVSTNPPGTNRMRKYSCTYSQGGHMSG